MEPQELVVSLVAVAVAVAQLLFGLARVEALLLAVETLLLAVVAAAAVQKNPEGMEAQEAHQLHIPGR